MESRVVDDKPELALCIKLSLAADRYLIRSRPLVELICSQTWGWVCHYGDLWQEFKRIVWCAVRCYQCFRIEMLHESHVGYLSWNSLYLLISDNLKWLLNIATSSNQKLGVVLWHCDISAIIKWCHSIQIFVQDQICKGMLRQGKIYVRLKVSPCHSCQ